MIHFPATDLLNFAIGCVKRSAKARCAALSSLDTGFFIAQDELHSMRGH